MEYKHLEIEKKWQDKWEESEAFKAEDVSEKPKFYCLDMFPYPSGVGLHVGHPRGYVATDIISRYKRMRGYNVLHPMGWDAFGLPAENYALKTGIWPQISTAKNIEVFKDQLRILGLSYDWSKEINTTDPKYFKWTQWIFLKLFEKGLAYEAVLPINWCPSCKTGLANEEVVDGGCERCGTLVTRKDIRQWVLKITEYADRLIEDLELLDWPDKIKEMQKNWVGKSEGADITFKIKGDSIEEEVKVFTTRPDTLFGTTSLVLAPEHSYVVKNKEKFNNLKEVELYIESSKGKSDLERTDLAKDKTGIEVKGFCAINPVNGKEIPVWIADYVLVSYGYGAIMSVPAHDKRDYAFAKKYEIPIIEVISGGDILEEAYSGEGVLVNSDQFNGLNFKDAKEKIVGWLEEKGLAKKSINYKLRDWLFSRQRYWGEPIPVVHCDLCGVVPLSESDLPLELPKVDNYQPTGTGESPLAGIEDWVNTKCPKCSGPAKRETNTMPQWAGSCWYYLRFIDPNNDNQLVDPEKEKYFMPVDLYVGGAEHAVLHLLYARFWHKFLYDIGIVSTKEPFLKLKNQGMILGPDGQKMSKSKGNVISPNEIVEKYGTDTFRLYEMFIGPFEDAAAWNVNGVLGVRRFIDKVWLVAQESKGEGNSKDRILHQTIKKVGKDLENFKFNTAVSAFMILINHWRKEGATKDDFMIFLRSFYPFAPHISEELWEMLGNKKSIGLEDWPEFNPSMIEEDIVNVIIQVNGKVRDIAEIQRGASEEEVRDIFFKRSRVKEWIGDKEIKKVIFVKDKLMNLVI